MSIRLELHPETCKSDRLETNPTSDSSTGAVFTNALKVAKPNRGAQTNTDRT
jgi:hypothetical protein